MLNVDYAHYQSVFGGRLIPAADFDRIMRQAYAHVSRLTLERAEEQQEDLVQGKINDACCAVADLLFADEQPRVASETVGKWSKTFASDGKTTQQRIRSTVRLYLSGTGLTYTGVGR